jgi:biopolymer transport protein TolQ
MFQAGPMALVGSLGVVSQVVLLLLLFFSIFSWAVILSKWRVFRSADAEDTRFMAVLFKAKDIDEVFRHAQRTDRSPCARVFCGLVDRLERGQGTNHKTGLGLLDRPDGDAGGFTMDRHTIERTATHLAQAQLSRLEVYLPFLATTGNVSPFVGLFGTVLGIIDAFHEIGTQGTASIAAVAPGVSEALIATAAGLFTAIPAVMAYNYFLTRIRRTAFRMDSVTVELLSLLPAKATPAPVGVKG